MKRALWLSLTVLLIFVLVVAGLAKTRADSVVALDSMLACRLGRQRYLSRLRGCSRRCSGSGLRTPLAIKRLQSARADSADSSDATHTAKCLHWWIE
ncbi:hypothetical protein BMS3Bbin04_00389 [bacterium BMS3Bbin04]|nr:hypothetical protein BMS3Bbin04_00389 [bacterium BMS3Bbin04]